jgi:hypothetical protein
VHHQLLVNVVSVTGLPAGASVTVSHGLCEVGVGAVPTLVFPDRATPIVVSAVSGESITFTNTGSSTETAKFRCERGWQPEVDTSKVTPMLWQGGSSGGGGAGTGFTNVERFVVGNGQTAFVLATPVAGGERSAMVFLNGLARDPATDYFISGQTLTFLFSPSTGAKVLIYYAAAVA